MRCERFVHKCEGRAWAVVRVVAFVCAFAWSAHAQTPSPAPLLPTALAYDAAGNLYFTDTNRNQVFEATLGGSLTVVAGTGVQGFAGDDGPALSAELNAPQGIAIATDGTIYIADTGNQRVRAMIGGVIRTIAGTGTPGFGGDAGAANLAMFSMPTALAVDVGGALLICDSGNQRVRRVSDGVITTIAGDGVQGFAGDGGAAVAAELDTPLGIAVGGDGSVYIADSHNNRVRVIAADGTIRTWAGTGAAGFAGDGGAATAASLRSPRGIAVLTDGSVAIADSGNERVRVVNASGVISTVAGSGTQGVSTDGTAAVSAVLNSPRGLGVSGFGTVVFADALNHTLREVASDGALYAPAALAAGRTSSVSLSVSANPVYGQVSAAVSVSGHASTPMGTVQLLDGATSVAQGTLNAGAVTLNAPALNAGNHVLSAGYAGDGVNPAAVSLATAVTVSPAAVFATANAATIEYGQVPPALTGTITGVLPQDAGTVSALFAANVPGLANGTVAVGTYPIAATLTGSGAGNYIVTASPSSGMLTITQAASTTILSAGTQSYAGLPLLLSAQVASTTRGVPTGLVSFSDGGTVVTTATLANGAATGTYAAPAAGAHTITASYGGDANFKASASPAANVTVSAMPDFAIASSGSSTQTVLGGAIAVYALSVASQPGPFSGSVVMSVSGLPKGATATFSPPSVVPSGGSVAVTLSVQTIALSMEKSPLGFSARGVWWALLVPLLFVRKKRAQVWLAFVAAVAMAGLSGCGTRTAPTTQLPTSTYTLTVTGTSTNLAGAVVTHSTNVTLVVD